MTTGNLNAKFQKKEWNVGHRETDTIKQVDNESTKDVGITITLEADDKVVNPIIYNKTTNETFETSLHNASERQDHNKNHRRRNHS